MKPRSHQPVRPDVLAFWRTRSAELRQKLAEAPAAEQAWFWRVQHNIYRFLLNRYGTQDTQAPMHQCEPSAPQPPLPADNAEPPEPRSLTSFIASPGAGKRPRASVQVRPNLQDIGQVNQERYQDFQRVQDELAEAMRAERLRFQECVDQVRKYLGRPVPVRFADNKIINPLPPDAVLTHDEISQFLAEMEIVEPPKE